MTPIHPLKVSPDIETWRTYLPHWLVILVCVLIASTLDANITLAVMEEREQQAIHLASRISSEFDACLKGEWQKVTTEGKTIRCPGVTQ